MNDKQNANLNMFQAVSDVLEAHADKYSAIPVFKAAAAELKEQNALIRETDKELTGKKVQAATAEKQKTEDNMINQAVMVGRLTNVYAFDTGNDKLGAQTNITKSHFYNAHDNQKISLAKSILANAIGFAEEMKSYGLEQTMLDELAATVTAYETLIAKPREVQTDRKAQVKSLSQLFAETKSLIYDRLDKLMVLFKDSERAFYDAYFSARNIINTSYRKTETKP